MTAVDRVADNGLIHTLSGVLEQPAVLSPGRCEAPQQLPGFGRFVGVTQGEIGSMDTLCSEHCGPVNSPESVFSYVAEEDGTVCFLTRDSSYDTVIHIEVIVMTVHQNLFAMMIPPLPAGFTQPSNSTWWLAPNTL